MLSDKIIIRQLLCILQLFNEPIQGRAQTMTMTATAMA